MPLSSQYRFTRSALFTLTAGAALAAAALMPHPATAQKFLAGDHSIAGHVCIGPDCTDPETFGDETLKLKFRHPRLLFEDGNNGGAASDWMLSANSLNGIVSYFALEEIDTGFTPVQIDSGSPSNMLRVTEWGRVGIGTAFPGSTLHIADDYYPDIRLEGRGLGPLPPQTWSLINTGYFSIIDRTNSSKVPFRITPNSEQDLMRLSGNRVAIGGYFGIDSTLHVSRDDGTASLHVEEELAEQAARPLMRLTNYGRPDIVMANTATGGEWAFGAGTNFVLKTGAVGSADGDKTRHLRLYGATGNLEITGQIITGGTTCGGGCDAVFSDAEELMPQSAYAAAMWEQGFLPHVGPTAEGTPINMTEKLGGMLNALEHAHIYIDRQAAHIAEQEARITRLEQRLSALSGQVSME